MKYMTVVDGYICSLSDSYGTQKIDDAEFYHVINLIGEKPVAPVGYAYRLRADTLEWELVKLPPIEPEPLTDEDALTRYANSITGANDPDLISAAETLIEQRIKEENK